MSAENRRTAPPACYLFDLDGVLIDSEKDLADAVNHTLEVHGRQRLPDAVVGSFVGNGVKNLLRRAFGLGEDEPLPDGLLEGYRAYYLAHCTDSTTLYPGVREGLERLHAAGARLAVVTNKPLDMTREILSRLGVWPLFGSCVAPERVREMKPHPESLLLAMKELGAKPEETVMVGDTWTDIRAGRDAGAATCAVLYGIGDAERLKAENPDQICDTFAEFMERIAGLTIA